MHLSMREKEEKARLSAMLHSNEKLKNIPEAFRGNYSLDKEENLDSVVSKIENDWASVRQQAIQSGVFVEAQSAGNESIDNDIAMLRKINESK